MTCDSCRRIFEHVDTDIDARLHVYSGILEFKIHLATDSLHVPCVSVASKHMHNKSHYFKLVLMKDSLDGKNVSLEECCNVSEYNINSKTYSW